MEIVTEPDMTSGAQAAIFVRQLIALLKAIGVSDGKLAGKHGLALAVQVHVIECIQGAGLHVLTCVCWAGVLADVCWLQRARFAWTPTSRYGRAAPAQ